MAIPDGFVQVEPPADKPTAVAAAVRAGYNVSFFPDGAGAPVWATPAENADAIATLWAGYDALPDCRDIALSRVDGERSRRGEVLLPSDPESRFMALWHSNLLTYKIVKGFSLTAGEQAQEAQMFVSAQRGVELEAAAAAIRAEIGALTDPVAAFAFDAGASPLWPAWSAPDEGG